MIWCRGRWWGNPSLTPTVLRWTVCKARQLPAVLLWRRSSSLVKVSREQLELLQLLGSSYWVPLPPPLATSSSGVNGTQPVFHTSSTHINFPVHT